MYIDMVLGVALLSTCMLTLFVCVVVHLQLLIMYSKCMDMLTYNYLPLYAL